jgi:hypothetical protein
MPFIEGYQMGAIFQTAFTSKDLKATATHFVDTPMISTNR